MGNLIETVLQDAVLVSVQGNGEVCVQMICVLHMYREACIYSKGSLQGILYVCRKKEKCTARPTGHESMK